MPRTLHHAYHLYCGGPWEVPWQEHILAMSRTGLSSALETFVVGIVGPEQARESAKAAVQEAGATVVFEKEKGFEQETLAWISSFVQQEDGYMYYAHSKGAGYPNRYQDPWRRTMEYDCSIHWGECVSRLKEGKDCVGSIWHNTDRWGPHPYFAGNYWWATNEFLRTLPEIDKNDRFWAEVWLGLAPTKPINHHAFRDSDFPLLDWKEDWIHDR